MATERRIGLCDHLIGAAETVEVVDVQRAEINLHRVENAGDRNAQLLGARAVEIDEKLWHVDLEAAIGLVRIEHRVLVCLA